MKVTNREQEIIIKKAIENSRFYLTYDETEGAYFGEIYTDYRDTIDPETVQEILSQGNPKDTFYDKILEGYGDIDFDYRREVESDVIEYIEKHNPDFFDEVDEDIIKEYVQENVYFEYPYEHFLKQEFCVNIMVDTGDLNYDYALNCIYPYYEAYDNENVSDNASIIWLAKQQGYAKEELLSAMSDLKSDYKSKEITFLQSVYNELLNSASSMNCLHFLVKLSLEEIFELQERLKEDKKKLKEGCGEYGYLNPENRLGTDSIKIDKSVICGLVDTWNGGGSLLEIQLEKDVILPLKFIDDIVIDGKRNTSRGYSIHNIYGVCDDLWQGNLVKFN